MWLIHFFAPLSVKKTNLFSFLQFLFSNGAFLTFTPPQKTRIITQIRVYDLRMRVLLGSLALNHIMSCVVLCFHGRYPNMTDIDFFFVDVLNIAWLGLYFPLLFVKC